MLLTKWQKVKGVKALCLQTQYSLHCWVLNVDNQQNLIEILNLAARLVSTAAFFEAPECFQSERKHEHRALPGPDVSLVSSHLLASVCGLLLLCPPSLPWPCRAHKVSHRLCVSGTSTRQSLVGTRVPEHSPERGDNEPITRAGLWWLSAQVTVLGWACLVSVMLSAAWDWKRGDGQRGALQLLEGTGGPLTLLLGASKLESWWEKKSTQAVIRRGFKK